MTTVSKLIDDCSGMLHSYTGLTEAATFLTEGISDTATTIPVQHPTRLLQGFVEIDDELVSVMDQGDASVTLFPNGRGAMNTDAVPHAVNARVVNDPLVPRARLFAEIQATILQLRDYLWVVKPTTFLSSPVQSTYPLPDDCKRVLRVQYEAMGPTKEWPDIRTWTVDKNADTTTGQSITLGGWYETSRTVQITYAASLPVPATPTDDLEALGIPSEMHDVIRFGACWRAVQMMAPSRLNFRSIEQQTLSPQSPVDSVAKVAQQFFGMFQLRRDEERKRLLDNYPTRKHYVR